MMESESDAARLRVEWIGALALLRLVGDVLEKVDSVRYPYLKADIKRHWEQLKERKDPVFWDFIKGARDRAVHRYDIDLYDRSEVEISIKLPDGSTHSDKLDECLFMPLLDGFMAGEDARDVYLHAITWWDLQLSQFEGMG